jgi:hypothetical protein
VASTVATIADILGFAPILPTADEIDPSRLVLSYNDAADTLYIHFFQRGQPAVSVDVNEFLYLRVDEITHRVVGLQIEGYLIYVVHKHPEWLSLAELAGIPVEVIEKARDRYRAAAGSGRHADLEAVAASGVVGRCWGACYEQGSSVCVCRLLEAW